MSLSKNINPALELVQPRKTRPFITERLLMGCIESNKTHKKANIADPDQMPQKAASDQGLHCLLTECSIKI